MFLTPFSFVDVKLLGFSKVSGNQYSHGSILCCVHVINSCYCIIAGITVHPQLSEYLDTLIIKDLDSQIL